MNSPSYPEWCEDTTTNPMCCQKLQDDVWLPDSGKFQKSISDGAVCTVAFRPVGTLSTSREESRLRDIVRRCACEIRSSLFGYRMVSKASNSFGWVIDLSGTCRWMGTKKGRGVVGEPSALGLTDYPGSFFWREGFLGLQVTSFKRRRSP